MDTDSEAVCDCVADCDNDSEYEAVLDTDCEAVCDCDADCDADIWYEDEFDCVELVPDVYPVDDEFETPLDVPVL